MLGKLCGPVVVKDIGTQPDDCVMLFFTFCGEHLGQCSREQPLNRAILLAEKIVFQVARPDTLQH